MSTVYKVSIYSTPLMLPLSFAAHAYVVTEHNGIVNRYDMYAPGFTPDGEPCCGLIYKNSLPVTTGFSIIFSKNTKFNVAKGIRWRVRKCSSVTGDAGSPAHSLYEFIENGGLKNYPYPESYRLLKGPNSNTFPQWIIDQVPECKLSLPWNAWGKNYR